MEDLLYVAITFALIGISVLFVKGCDRLIGPDAHELEDEAEQVARPERGLESLTR